MYTVPDATGPNLSKTTNVYIFKRRLAEFNFYRFLHYTQLSLLSVFIVA